MSTLYIDLKYAAMLPARLQNFKQIKAHLYTFSHKCEEATYGKLKTRAYILPAGDHMNVYCHHCGMSHRLSTFMHDLDPNLYQEYRLETFKEAHAPDKKISIVFPDFEEPPEQKPTQNDDTIIWVQDLPMTHPVRKYVQTRKIPEEFFSKIGVVADFNAFAGKYMDSFKEKKKVYPRLILPFFDKDGSVSMYSCRAFGKEQPKYIKLKVKDQTDHIYGLWRIDENKDIFALEGQIDSLFLDNAIAVGSADYSSRYLEEHKDKIIVVPDSDYKRNPQVFQSLMKVVDAGFRIALMPESIPWKDINDCVAKGGYQGKVIQDILLNNISSGVAAKLELNYRKRF